MRKARSEFFKLRRKIGLTIEQAAELCEVTPRTIVNWDKKGSPGMALKLLRLWDQKYVGIAGWEGFCFSRGNLYLNGKLLANPEGMRTLPEFRRQFNAYRTAEERRFAERAVEASRVRPHLVAAGRALARRVRGLFSASLAA